MQHGFCSFSGLFLKIKPIFWFVSYAESIHLQNGTFRRFLWSFLRSGERFERAVFECRAGISEKTVTSTSMGLFSERTKTAGFFSSCSCSGLCQMVNFGPNKLKIEPQTKNMFKIKCLKNLCKILIFRPVAPVWSKVTKTAAFRQNLVSSNLSPEVKNGRITFPKVPFCWWMNSA